MQILKAELKDYEDIVSMTKTYALTSPYKELVDVRAVELITKEFLVEDKKIIFYVKNDGVPVGFLAGAALPFILGLDTIATEIAWWVDPEFRANGVGSLLLYAFEEWARTTGCAIISLSSMDAGVGEIYIKKGYKLQEYTYTKMVTCPQQPQQ